MNTERRFTNGSVETRAKSDSGQRVAGGYAAKFNRLSQDLGGFREQIAPGCFSKTIEEADIRCLFNHDPSLLLGRNASGTLRLSEDDTGLGYDFDVPDTTTGRDVAVLLERGDVTQSSFGFTVIKDDWSIDDNEQIIRTLLEVKLYDVSPVTYPAYLDTDSGMRGLSTLAEARALDLDEVIAAARAHELRRIVAGEPNQEPAETTPAAALTSRYAALEAKRPAPARL